jgi:PhoPQ-activated pathogenicity-related protein
MRFPLHGLSRIWFAIGGFAAGAVLLSASEPALTALDRYVREHDPAYRYELRDTHSIQGVTVHQLRMVSQKWLTDQEVQSQEWWHWLVIYRPPNVRHDTALLFITGGSNKDERPPRPDGMLAQTAMATGSVVAELRMVPNQPLIFHDDGQERYEDDLIAYGWDQFLRGGREEWLARLPMTKSAVRAMDTITDFFAKPEQGGLRIDRFVVSGGSKRGWTTWTTAVVDTRVVAIAPLVIDLLNVVPSFKHHWEAYGFYAPAVGDYERHGIMNWQDTPEYERLVKIVEPYEYRDRLTLPKLMINATGDQFFLPDSHRFFFDDLKGPKFLRYVPNGDHSLRDTDAPQTLAAWHYAIINRRPLPRFDWSIDWDRGEIEVKTKDRPAAVKLWQATNRNQRDFRVDTIGRTWTSSPLAAVEEGVYRARVSKPEEGWTGFFIELTYPIEGAPAPLKLTSGVAVVPDVLPFQGKMPNVAPRR